MERFICIHGHFYQPPRENPWLEAIELQDSAYPYHDWDQRITAECYAPNARSRILDPDGWIVEIVNNYAKMSFNFGPTLLAWLEKNTPGVYQAILQADKESMENFNGHGSALAQAYNHLILPLADYRDKRTQILWGLHDFERRFGRKPEGMWLPETAVDLETLEIMAGLGVSFTVLAPHQARRVRSVEGGAWRDVSNADIDPTMPYIQRLKDKKSIALFFYDGPISRAVAFEGLLNQGEIFAQRLMDGFSDVANRPQLASIATDGESYGHHHRHGDMALAYAMRHIESHDLARFTNYGEFLEKFPPTHEVEIFENSSWSCAHGIERWRGDCGCNSGGRPEWNQAWRAPLRETLDWLRDKLAGAYEEKAGQFLENPWRVRDDYLQVVWDRSEENIERFFRRRTGNKKAHADKRTLLGLLELQRHAMFMYTSCGWFFDELSGIETVQIIQYAARAIQLARQILGLDLEEEFLRRLEKAKSNIPEHKNGRVIYDKFVKTAMIDLRNVGAHYAISSIFEKYDERTPVYCFSVEIKDYHLAEAGMARLAVGAVEVTSTVVLQSKLLCFGVLHFGDHNIVCGIGDYTREEDYESFRKGLLEAFGAADFTETLQLLQNFFGDFSYSLKSLFRDEQRRIINQILEPLTLQAETFYAQLFDRNLPLVKFLRNLNVPIPRSIGEAVELTANKRFLQIMEEEGLRCEILKPLLRESISAGISLDVATLEFSVRKALERLMEQVKRDIPKTEPLASALDAAALVESLPFEVVLRKTQDLYYDILTTSYVELKEGAGKTDRETQRWLSLFEALGEKLRVRIN